MTVIIADHLLFLPFVHVSVDNLEALRFLIVDTDGDFLITDFKDDRFAFLNGILLVLTKGYILYLLQLRHLLW